MKRRPLIRLLLAGLATLLLAGCATGLPQNSLEPASEDARSIDGLFRLTFAIATVIFVGVQGVLIWATIRYRQRRGEERPVKQVHGNNALEIGWTIAPALILVGIALPTVRTIFDIAEKPTGALEVKVIGHQWWWEFQYPAEEVVTANELHIPVGRPVYLEMTTDDADVIHSFWVPRLSGKRDVVPGRTNFLTVEADEAGTYLGQCAEFCGLSHANMRFRVIADPSFDTWLASQRANSTIPPDLITPPPITTGAGPTTTVAAVAAAPSDPIAAGWQLFLEKGCSTCHAINGTQAKGGGVNPGPNLTHIASRSTFAGGLFERNDANLARWLKDPSAMKPMEPDNNRGMPTLGLTEDEIDTLVVFLQSLT